MDHITSNGNHLSEKLGRELIAAGIKSLHFSVDAQTTATYKKIRGAKLEPSLAAAAPGSRYQFERQGYFCIDLKAPAGSLVFNRTVSLKDAWTKIEKAGG